MNGSRPSREKWEDLELRLAPSSLLKERELGFLRRPPPEFIIIEDEDDDGDDDDGQEQASNFTSLSEMRSLFSRPAPSLPAIPEWDLDLRLGVAASNGSSGNANSGRTYANKYHEVSRTHFTEVKLRCAICMDTMKEETSTLCGHIFCKSCITNTIVAQRKCPTCRKEISLSSIHRIFLPGPTS